MSRRLATCRVLFPPARPAFVAPKHLRSNKTAYARNICLTGGGGRCDVTLSTTYHRGHGEQWLVFPNKSRTTIITTVPGPGVGITTSLPSREEDRFGSGAKAIRRRRRSDSPATGRWTNDLEAGKEETTTRGQSFSSSCSTSLCVSRSSLVLHGSAIADSSQRFAVRYSVIS